MNKTFIEFITNFESENEPSFSEDTKENLLAEKEFSNTETLREHGISSIVFDDNEILVILNCKVSSKM